MKTLSCLGAGLVVFALLLPPPSRADSLGRLFFTPEERIVLQQMERAPARSPVASRITVNGVVRTSGGRSTVWINGMPQEVGRGDSGSSLVAGRVEGSAVTLLPPGSQTPVRVKVGESIRLKDEEDGTSPSADSH